MLYQAAGDVVRCICKYAVLENASDLTLTVMMTLATHTCSARPSSALAHVRLTRSAALSVEECYMWLLYNWDNTKHLTLCHIAC